MQWRTQEKGWNVPIFNWASNLEASAMDQAINLAKMPCIYHHVALAPDCHTGYAIPIGGIVAYKNAVSPYGVGNDAGCLDCDTEVLTPNGWIRIADYDGQKILQFDPDGNVGCFLKPFSYIKKPCAFFYHLKNEDGTLNQMLSDEHRLLVYNGLPQRRTYQVLSVQELYSKKTINKGFYTFNTCFNIINNPGVNLSDELIRIDVMIQSDGSIRSKYEGYNLCELHFRKERKIERARKLLSDANIEYHEYKVKDGSTYISFHCPKEITKDLTIYYNATFEQLKIVRDECLKWDGCESYRSSYSNTDKASVDVIQFVFIATGTRASITTHKDKRNQNWSVCYNVIPSRTNFVGFGGNVSLARSVDGYKYCFKTQTGFFLCRRNGFTFLTGNCGMHSVKTNLDASVFDDMRVRRDFQERIKKRIPVGNAVNGEEQQWDGFERYLDNGGLEEFCSSRIRKALKSSGDGNHFIELQKSEMDLMTNDSGKVWLMIHSGSRSLGGSLAKHYHEIAKTLCRRWFVKLPSEDYSFLPVDDKNGQDFIRDMNFAIEYALENRKRMMAVMVEELANMFPDVKVEFEHDIHHNFARLENHFGENVWVHRKGATSARKDEICIIPGSMGTASYICKGLGNPESFMSCSHGAGRRMSRTVACQKLTVKQCDEAMKGIVCERWHKVNRGKAQGMYDLSEAPGAYKDIEEVIENEKELVTPLVRLTPLACLKG